MEVQQLQEQGVVVSVAVVELRESEMGPPGVAELHVLTRSGVAGTHALAATDGMIGDPW